MKIETDKGCFIQGFSTTYESLQLSKFIVQLFILLQHKQNKYCLLLKMVKLYWRWNFENI